MPPTLDLSRTRHAKMMISPPRINLRKAASYNHDRGPLSSTSSRFNFNHLVFSPPPSPGLPSLSPPVKKPARRRLIGTIRPLKVVRYTIRFGSVVVVFYVALVVLTWLFGEPIPAAPQPPKPVQKDGIVMVAQKEAPDFPTPIVVTDNRGRAKWTVSIPPGTDFPLTMGEYAEMCTRCRQVAARAQQLRSQGHGFPQVSLGVGSDPADQDFMDVREAEDAGYFTKTPSGNGRSAKGTDAEKPVCKKSLTYVLESSDAGLGKMLMMLWIAYGLAEKEGRAFFIDDTRWAYGKYNAIFQPPPAPSCSAPPSHEILPCPRHARHLVTSSATMDELFGSLTKHADPPSESHDRALRKTQFGLARRGYEALFRLNADDAHYVDARIRELLANKMVSKSKGHHGDGLAVGVHVRRGDLHPFEYQYRRSYTPLSVYSDAAREAVEARLNHHHHHQPFGSDGDDDAATAQTRNLVLLASDDPMVYESAEFAGVSRAQERIKLASKQAIQQANPDKTVMHKFVDETFGWEGGFFAAMFWNLGVTAAHAAGVPDGDGSSSSSSPSAETRRLRSLVGRAYMMDLAVLADASDVVVCAVSAVGCRLLAVMMGWDSALEQGNWVNVDGGYGWIGLEG